MMFTETGRRKVLVVDDVPGNIRILADALKNSYQVLAATDGREGLRIARSDDPPDLILLDVLMPEMDGFQVCAQLKEDKATREIPVIFVSTGHREEDKSRGLSLGAVDYITRPFNQALIKLRVDTQLELKRYRDHFQRISNLDGVTGVPNQRHLLQRLESEWRRAMRNGTLVSLIAIGLDQFEAINEEYGHEEGDICLSRIASLLAAALRRASDFCGRLDAGSFLIILPGQDEEGAVMLAEEIIKKAGVLSRSLKPDISLSAGIYSVIPTQDSSYDEVLGTLRTTLKEALEQGGDRVLLFQKQP